MSRFFIGKLNEKGKVSSARELTDQEVIFELNDENPNMVNVHDALNNLITRKGEEFFIADKEVGEPKPKFEIYKDLSGKGKFA